MPHTSTTSAVPIVGAIPGHIAVIMDGNVSWEKQNATSIDITHRQEIKANLMLINACLSQGVSHLTLFAPLEKNEAGVLDTLRLSSLTQIFVDELCPLLASVGKDILGFKFVGDIAQFPAPLQQQLLNLQTTGSSRLSLIFCAHYDGCWDIAQALNRFRREMGSGVPITEELLAQYLSLADTPEPDLMIRAGGEVRLSHFLIWELAYSELYFTKTLWPDFDRADLQSALSSYQTRERRFGRTSAQVIKQSGSEMTAKKAS